MRGHSCAGGTKVTARWRAPFRKETLGVRRSAEASIPGGFTIALATSTVLENDD